MSAEDPQHPADVLVNTFHSLISGDAIKQALRDGYDKLMGNTPQQSDHDKAVAAMNANTNAHNNDAANASFLSAQQAAKIRKQASK